MARTLTKSGSLLSRTLGWFAEALRATRDLRRWAMVSRLRAAVVAVTATVLLSLSIALWALVAKTVAEPERPVTLADALRALDENRFDEAQRLSLELQQTALAPQDYGGPAFVLGAVKARLAAREPAGWTCSRPWCMRSATCWATTTPRAA